MQTSLFLRCQFGKLSARGPELGPGCLNGGFHNPADNVICFVCLFVCLFACLFS